LLDGIKKFSVDINDFQLARIIYSELPDLAENIYRIGPVSEKSGRRGSSGILAVQIFFGKSSFPLLISQKISP
jgi:hypothetical protein